MKILFGILAVAIVAAVFACFKISGDCAENERQQESNDGKGGNGCKRKCEGCDNEIRQ